MAYRNNVNYVGCKIDLNDPEERKRFYFNMYWQIIKEKESLTPENVISAYYLLKNGEMHKLVSNAFESYEEEHNLSLCWNKKRKRSNGKTSVKKEKANVKEPVSIQNCVGKPTEIQGKRGYSKCIDSLPPLQMPSEQSQLLHEVLPVLGDAQDVEPACKDFTRINEQEHNSGLRKSYPGSTSKGNAASCHMPLEHVEPVSTVVFQSELPEASAPPS